MTNVNKLLREAEQAVALSKWPEATKKYEQVIRTTEHPDALLYLSYSESNAGNYRQARMYALRATAAKPRNATAVVRLLSRLRHFNEADVLRRFVETSPFLQAMNPQVQQAVSAQLSYLGDQDQALQFLDRAIAGRPGLPPLLLARAQVNVFRGDFDAAQQDIEHCLRLAPQMATAWWTLASLRKQTPGSNHVDQIQKLVASVSLSSSDRAYLNYALHKELDDLGDIAGASQALDAACKARRVEQQYSDSQMKRLFQRLKQLPTTGSSSAADEFTPLFVVGMFRSGTTLLERLMGGNPAIVNAGELHDMTSAMRNAVDHYCHGVIDETVIARAADVDYSEVGRQYLDGVRWRLGGHTHITDKWPPNHMNVGFICQSMPSAKIIHMVRDPVETCFSNLREMFSGAAPYSYDQTELASYYLQYESLMAHWHERFPGRILDVHYSRLTSDTENVMREVSRFCDFDFMDSMLDPRSAAGNVATASAVQIRNAVISRAKPKWEPYRQYLQPLMRGLEQGAAVRSG